MNDKIAEMIIQMDDETLSEFVENYEVDLDKEMADGWGRMLKRCKTYEGLWFGLAAMLLNHDHVTARYISAKAENGKLDSIDYRIQFLLTTVAQVRSSDQIDGKIVKEYDSIRNSMMSEIFDYELNNGYFHRNKVNLADEYEELLMYDTRVQNGISVYDSIYNALFILLKFRLYTLAYMPKEVLV